MDLLIDRKNRRSVTLLVVATVSLMTGCVLLKQFGLSEETLAFSHKLHFEDEGLDCMACHANFEDSDDPGMPVRAQCMLCHEDIDAEQPPEKRIDSLFDGDVYRAQNLSRLPEEVVFSHMLHAVDSELCGTCHEGIEQNERLDDRMAVSMDDCSACHQNLGLANECSTCHSVLREDVAPASHGGNWQRYHGQVFRSGSELTANRCSMCHEESSCTSCHLDEPPENHNNFWRRRGHGITARMDRSSCMVCHDSDSCDSCHQEVAPLNHTGAWATGLNRHCLSCHLTSRENGCTVCHQSMPSHSTAAPQPPSHSPGMNCRQCHGISAPLPHVTKGEDCNICHQ